MKENATQKYKVKNEQEKQHSFCESCNKYSKLNFNQAFKLLMVQTDSSACDNSLSWPINITPSAF